MTDDLETKTATLVRVCMGVAHITKEGQRYILHDVKCDLPHSEARAVASYGKHIFITHGLSSACYQATMCAWGVEPNEKPLDTKEGSEEKA